MRCPCYTVTIISTGITLGLRADVYPRPVDNVHVRRPRVSRACLNVQYGMFVWSIKNNPCKADHVKSICLRVSRVYP